MSGFDALDRQIARLRALRDANRRAAAIAAPLLLAENKRTAAAGTSAEGTPWPPKKGGGRALPEAAGAISVELRGTVVNLVLRGPYVLHHYGTGHAPRRPILPSRGVDIPPAMRAICRRAAAQAIREVLR